MLEGRPICCREEEEKNEEKERQREEQGEVEQEVEAWTNGCPSLGSHLGVRKNGVHPICSRGEGQDEDEEKEECEIDEEEVEEESGYQEAAKEGLKKVLIHESEGENFWRGT